MARATALAVSAAGLLLSGACRMPSQNGDGAASTDGEPGDAARACTTSTECGSSERCAGGRCVFGARFGGDPCQSAEQCLSALCTANGCCDLPCLGPCQSCLLAGSIGRCVPRPPGATASECGAYRCASTGRCATSCASDGDCAAAGRCSTNGACAGG